MANELLVLDDNGCPIPLANGAACQYLGITAGIPAWRTSGASTDAGNLLTTGSDCNPYLSCEAVQDCIGIAIANGLGATYNDALDSITTALAIPITSGAGVPANTVNSPVVYTDTSTGDIYYRDQTGATVRIEHLYPASEVPYTPGCLTGVTNVQDALDTLCADAHPEAALTTSAAPFSWDTSSQVGNIPLVTNASVDSTTNVLTITPGDGSAQTLYQETALQGLDTATVTLTTNGLFGHELTADVNLSAQAGNGLSINADGLYMPEAIPETPFTAIDGVTVNLTTSGTSDHTLTAEVNVSSAVGNILQVNNDGLYVPTPEVQEPLVVVDSPSVNLGVSGNYDHTLTADVIISPTTGNQLSILGDGLYVPTPAATAQTPVTVVDTTSIDFTASGTDNHTVTGVVKISATADNQLSILADGLYVPSSPTLPLAAACTLPVEVIGMLGGDQTRFNWSDLDATPVMAYQEIAFLNVPIAAVGTSTPQAGSITLTNSHACKTMTYLVLLRTGRTQFASAGGRQQWNKSVNMTGPGSGNGVVARFTWDQASAALFDFPADVWTLAGTLAPGASATWTADVILNVTQFTAGANSAVFGRCHFIGLGVYS